MSFGANSTSKTAENNLGGSSNLALNSLFPAAFQSGQQNLAAGQGTLNTGLNTTAAGLNTAQPGINFMNTVLGGNQANTASALQPNIDQIRQGTGNNLTAINTLMPRGGGRSGALFGQSFAPQAQMQNLFNNARTSAASTLPGLGFQQAGVGLGQAGVGLGQIGAGTNLFNAGNNSLNSANSANSTLGQFGFTQQQISNQLDAAIASGLFGLATTPFGGGSAAGGLLGLIGQKH